jgi:putative radical SAM enzyme (TIGR03279 family)
MITITSIKKNSTADKKGLRAGDAIESINGESVNDMLDFHVYASYLPLEIRALRGKKSLTVNVETVPQIMKLGIEVEDLKIRHCGNRCLFCFVDQNPKGLRKTLYVKDEDFRYSYLYGSFCTMSKISGNDLVRIVKQKLTPLYISVHAIENSVRMRLLGLKGDDNFLEKLKFLSDHGIELHTQIVMVPGINDGKVLRKTIETLYSVEGVLSVAVVPLGKTKHRKGLAELPSVTKRDAEKAVDLVEKYQRAFKADSGSRFVFAADEFYLKAGRAIPSNASYEKYEQYENGVGLVRSFIERTKAESKDFPESLRKPRTILFVTGKSFVGVLEKYLIKKLNKIKNLSARAVAAENVLLGPEVTVSGLLCGKDMIRAAEETGVKADVVVIPGTSLSTDGVTLDDMTLAGISKALGTKVITSDRIREALR